MGDEDEAVFGYELSGDELRRVIGLPADQRLRYYVDACTDSGQVWTIGIEDELIVLAGDGEEQFVVAFPHPEFGQEWFTTTEIEEVDLVAVRTEDWVREILPGLEEAGVQVLVFPTSEDEGLLIGSTDLANLHGAGELPTSI